MFRSPIPTSARCRKQNGSGWPIFMPTITSANSGLRLPCFPEATPPKGHLKAFYDCAIFSSGKTLAGPQPGPEVASDKVSCNLFGINTYKSLSKQTTLFRINTYEKHGGVIVNQAQYQARRSCPDPVRERPSRGDRRLRACAGSDLYCQAPPSAALVRASYFPYSNMVVTASAVALWCNG